MTRFDFKRSMGQHSSMAYLMLVVALLGIEELVPVGIQRMQAGGQFSSLAHAAVARLVAAPSGLVRRYDLPTDPALRPVPTFADKRRAGDESSRPGNPQQEAPKPCDKTRLLEGCVP